MSFKAIKQKKPQTIMTIHQEMLPEKLQLLLIVNLKTDIVR